ncbi:MULTISPECIES: hypothetical protein [unclassified Microcoleus]
MGLRSARRSQASFPTQFITTAIATDSKAAIAHPKTYAEIP